jgi:hypothetical protein
MESFMQPFQWQLWVTLFTSVFVVGTAMYVLDSHSPFLRYSSQPPSALVRSNSLTEHEYRFITDGRPAIVDGGGTFTDGVSTVYRGE